MAARQLTRSRYGALLGIARCPATGANEGCAPCSAPRVLPHGRELQAETRGRRSPRCRQSISDATPWASDTGGWFGNVGSSVPWAQSRPPPWRGCPAGRVTRHSDDRLVAPPVRDAGGSSKRLRRSRRAIQRCATASGPECLVSTGRDAAVAAPRMREGWFW